MKILLTHAYSKDNKGDAAIISVLLKQLDNAFSASNISILIYDDETKYRNVKGLKFLSNSMYVSVYHFKNSIFRALYILYIELSLLLWALLHRVFGVSLISVLPRNTHKIANEYLESDLYVPVGGGYLKTKSGIRENVSLLLLLNPIIIGILLKKPIILYTQSIGPFATTFQEWILRIMLNKTQRIFAREDYTIATLKHIGVRTNLVTKTTDAGFLFESDQEFQLSDYFKNNEALNSKTLVGITVRKWLKKKEQNKFEEEMALFVDKITSEQEICVIFIPQVTSTVHNDDDREVANRIVNRVANKQDVINCTDNYDHYELKRLYSSLDFLVGTRFHSVIFSLTSYVPVLVIEYEYKAGGIMKDLGLSEWVISMENVTKDNLYEKFTHLLNDGDIYKEKLRKVLPDYLLKAKEVENQMKEAYYNFKHSE